jgi:Family of unknown function (DUF6221)
MDITAFLGARLDEDERAAKAACLQRRSLAWSVDPEEWAAGVGVKDGEGKSVAVAHGTYRAEHIARHDPARVLADVAAKRAIVALHDDEGGAHECVGHDSAWGTVTDYERDCRTLRLLAAPYADHPDFDPAWAVDAPRSEEV